MDTRGILRPAAVDRIFGLFALDLGCFDHAHFIADFRAVVGRSPAQYEAELTGAAERDVRNSRAGPAGVR